MIIAAELECTVNTRRVAYKDGVGNVPFFVLRTATREEFLAERNVDEMTEWERNRVMGPGHDTLHYYKVSVD